MSNLCTCVECMPDSQEPEMSNEDKMREEFERFVNNPHMLNRSTVPGENFEYTHPWTAGAWKAWKACAAIKDAEIVKERQLCTEYIEQRNDAYKEIAARDLMIKELREESKDYMLAISVLFAIQAEGDCLAERKPSKDIHTYNAFIYLSTQGKRLSEALAKSEHHESRALDNTELPDSAFCAAGVEPCACAVANNIDAARYRALRNQDIESNFPRSGVFIGKVPDNQCLTGIDADNAVDALLNKE